MNLDIELAPEAAIAKYFDGLHGDEISVSQITGGQSAANAALENYSVAGYARDRSEVLPVAKRGASVLSPYIRHNLLPLKRVWSAVGGFGKDTEKYRDELLWQEYARHLYARLGTRAFGNLRFEANWQGEFQGWNRDQLCLDSVLNELEQDGWLVNQTRMWLASDYTVRNDNGWVAGQDFFFQHLLDGSRAANLVGWQWTVGSGNGRPYGFARWQVEKRAPGLCNSCPLKNNCPIQSFPKETEQIQLEADPLLSYDPNLENTIGPTEVAGNQADVVYLTVESLGDEDPALMANPELPVLFVFNEPALKKLQLSSKRLAFYWQTLQDLAQRRDLTVMLGDPLEILQDFKAATTFAPVPSFSKIKPLITQLHPWPWLRTPHDSSLRSFSSWRAKLGR